MEVGKLHAAMLLAILCVTFPLTHAEENITVTFDPEVAMINRLEKGDVVMTINISTIVDANGNSIVNDLDDFNLTLVMEPEANMAYPQMNPEVTYDPDLQVINSTITIYTGPTVGYTVINIAMTLTLADGSVYKENLEYHVIITRVEQKTTIQDILGYIMIPMGLLLLFLVCCQANVATLRDSVAWIFGTLLTQGVIVPVCVLIVVSLFWVPPPGKLGVMTCAFSPGVMLSLAFGILVDADLTLLATLIFFSGIFSFAVMPLWSIQFAHTRDGPNLTLTPADMPYVWVLIYSSICLGVIISGLVIRHYFQTFANNVKKLIFPVAVIMSAFSIFAMFFGGLDMLPSVHYRVGVSCFLWALIMASLIIVAMLGVGANGMKWRASGMFLLVKTPHLTYQVINKALDHPQSDIAMVSAYFFSLITLIMAIVVVIVYLILKCMRFKNTDVGRNAELSNSVDAEMASASGHTGYRRLDADGEEEEGEEDKLKDTMRNRADILGRSAMKMGAFGAPSLLVWI